MERFVEQALVLSSVDYGEADRVVTLFTRARGKLTAFAAGARKSKRRFAGALEPFTLVQAQLCERRGDTYRLDGVDVEAGFYGVRRELPLIARALYCVELCREMVRDREPHPELFALLVGYLAALDRREAGPTSLLAFELEALSHAGLRPRFDACALCAGETGEKARFDPSHGGVVCGRCAHRAQPSVPVDSELVASLRALQAGRRDPLPAKARRSARELLNLFIAHHLGRKLNSVDFMAQAGLDLSAADVVCIGEALVDFLPQETGREVRDVETWTRCSGGAPANVAIGLARLGVKSALLGVTGKDEFGIFLTRALAEEGVDTSHLRMTDEGKTGLAFVSIKESGERSFSFHRTRSAEFFLDEVDADLPFVLGAKALHCGTNSLIWRPAQSAAVKMLQAAQGAGRLVSCDPNLRLHVWADPNELRALLGHLLPPCTVVKLSEEEISFVTGTGDVDQALVALRKLGVVLPVVTRAAEGAAFFWQGRVVRVPATPARAVDSTGAGDGFMAALLFGLTRLYPDAAALKQAGIGELREVVTFACQAAARVVEQVGAVAGLPRLAEIQDKMPRLLRPAAEKPEAAAK